MDIGLLIFPTDETIDPVTLAREAEARGFSSLWFPEHTHIPVSRATPWPGGADLPRQYYRTFDPFVALAMAAAVTTTLRIGTGICLIIQRDPIVTAKEAASLDRLSHGRFQFGIGAGWNVEEMNNHGTDPATRFALMEERLAAIKTMWRDDEAEFHGRFVDIERSFVYPKPAQLPHPPVYLGGSGPAALDRVVRIADAWLPIPGRGVPIGESIARLNDKAAAAGREPIPVHVFGAPPVAKVIDGHRAGGAAEVLIGLPQSGTDDVLRALDEAAPLVAEFAG